MVKWKLRAKCVTQTQSVYKYDLRFREMLVCSIVEESI